jgi:hypothetical protein
MTEPLTVPTPEQPTEHTMPPHTSELPAASVAATNLFSGLGKDFAASPERVIWATGAGVALFSSIGALLGGYLADRVDRKTLYLSGGALAGLCSRVGPQYRAAGSDLAHSSYRCPGVFVLERQIRPECSTEPCPFWRLASFVC